MECILLCHPAAGFTVLSGFAVRSFNNHVFEVLFLCCVTGQGSTAARCSGSTSGSAFSASLAGGLQNALLSEMFFRRRGSSLHLDRSHSIFFQWAPAVISVMCQTALLQNKYSEMGREEGENGGKNGLPSELLI